MTQDEIIRMAREAGLIGEGEPDNPIEELMRDALIKMLPRFAALVAQNYMAKACGGCVVKQCYKRMDAEIEAAVLAERVRMCKQFNIPMELANETATSNEAD